MTSGKKNSGDNPGLTIEQIEELIDLRHHSVGLERVQRCHLGLDDEPMEFSTETLAKMLEDVAENCDEKDAFTLRGIVNALRGTDSGHCLVLKQKRRGKFVGPDQHSAMHIRNQSWLFSLAQYEIDGWPTEAAVAEIMRWAKATRATVFAGVKDAEKFLADGRAMFPDSPNFVNPRPTKTQKT